MECCKQSSGPLKGKKENREDREIGLFQTYEVTVSRKGRVELKDEGCEARTPQTSPPPRQHAKMLLRTHITPKEFPGKKYN